MERLLLITSLREEAAAIRSSLEWNYDQIENAVGYGIAKTLENLADRIEGV
jgi:hypothetical protein